MRKNSTERPTKSRPRDPSLEAYKDWVRDLARRFTTYKHPVELTEEEWVRSWKEYWNEVKEVSQDSA